MSNTDTKINSVLLPLWEGYKKDVLLPANAGEIQIQECKRAFYAGFSSSHAYMCTLADADLSDDLSFEVLDQLEKELQEFINSIERGEN